MAGCRNLTNEKDIEKVLRQYIAVKDIIITGGCRGVDRVAHDYARRYFCDTEVYEADWDKHGKAAGPIRNRKMAEDADQLVAIWDGKSRGTKNMIDEALKAGIETHVHFIGSD